MESLGRWVVRCVFGGGGNGLGCYILNLEVLGLQTKNIVLFSPPSYYYWCRTKEYWYDMVIPIDCLGKWIKYPHKIDTDKCRFRVSQ